MYLSVFEEDELCDEDIIGKENEYVWEVLLNGLNWDIGFDVDFFLE